MKREITHCNREEIRLGGMSEELRQNARQTMGELRDLMRTTGISWALIDREINNADHRATGLDRSLDKLDSYTCGIGHSLHGLPRNI